MQNQDELFADLVATPEFHRLKKIRFLGAIDYFSVRSPNGSWGSRRHTRFQHTLGVTELAVKYGAMRRPSKEDLRLIYAGALLHDIGHGPFSHSAESSFRSRFGIDHHSATREIILGTSPLGMSVYNVLRDHKIDLDRLIGLISGKDISFDGIFSGPINIDTIDGIVRTRKYIKVKHSFYGLPPEKWSSLK